MTPSPRKRQRQADQAPSQDDDPSRHPSKRQKPHPARRPPAFWDNLTYIPLEPAALEEHNRRNLQQPTSSSTLQPSRRPVTRSFLSRIRALAEDGGPDLSDLRGYRVHCTTPEPEMSSSQSSARRRKRGTSSPSKKSTANTTTTKSTSPYDRAFQQHLIDFGIYPDDYEYPDGRSPPEPDNLDGIRQALAQDLPPPLFSNDDFRKFKRADTHAVKERQVTTSVVPIIQGDTEDSRCVAGEIPFTNLDPLTDGSLVSGNPDLFCGARPEQLNRRVRAKLRRRIIPSTQEDLPILPNFFLAVKGPEGSTAVATRQLNYDMALGAMGFHKLLTYTAEKPLFDNKAYVIGCTYHAGTLKMYTCHPIRLAARRTQPEFVMTQVNSWSLTGNPEAFGQGVRAYRQGMAWAKQQRDEAIGQANQVAQLKSGAPSDDDLSTSFAASLDSTTEHSSQKTLPPPPVYDSETSADELSHDFPPAKRSKMPVQPQLTARKEATDEQKDIT